MMMNKQIVFEQVITRLEFLNFKVVKKDDTRPWGGFFVID